MSLTKGERLARLGEVFTPAAPVIRHDLFAGRTGHVFAITNAIGQPGKHVALYGERGVGKTSLVIQLKEFLASTLGANRNAVRVNCTTQDIFSTVWSKVLRELQMDIPEHWTYNPPDPDEIRSILGAITVPTIIILDEFERMEDDDSLRQWRTQ